MIHYNHYRLNQGLNSLIWGRDSLEYPDPFPYASMLKVCHTLNVFVRLGLTIDYIDSIQSLYNNYYNVWLDSLRFNQAISLQLNYKPLE